MSNPYCEDFETWWKNNKLLISLSEDDKPIAYEVWKVTTEYEERYKNELTRWRNHVSKQIVESTECMDNSPDDL